MSDKRCRLVVVAIALGLILSCSSGTDEEGPAAAVQRFYNHLNDGDYSEARNMYNAEARAIMDDPELSSEGSFRSWAQDQTKNRTISSVEILQSEADETAASIECEIVYRDGSKKTSRVDLTQEEGEWKLGFSLDASP